MGKEIEYGLEKKTDVPEAVDLGGGTGERADAAVEMPFLPGEYLETGWPGKPEVPAVITAGWADPGQLRLRCHAVGTAPCGFEMLLCLRGDTATVQCFRSHDPLTDLYDGVASGVSSCRPE